MKVRGYKHRKKKMKIYKGFVFLRLWCPSCLLLLLLGVSRALACHWCPLSAFLALLRPFGGSLSPSGDLLQCIRLLPTVLLVLSCLFGSQQIIWLFLILSISPSISYTLLSMTHEPSCKKWVFSFFHHIHHPIRGSWPRYFILKPTDQYLPSDNLKGTSLVEVFSITKHVSNLNVYPPTQKVSRTECLCILFDIQRFINVGIEPHHPIDFTISTLSTRISCLETAPPALGNHPNGFLIYPTKKAPYFAYLCYVCFGRNMHLRTSYPIYRCLYGYGFNYWCVFFDQLLVLSQPKIMKVCNHHHVSITLYSSRFYGHHPKNNHESKTLHQISLIWYWHTRITCLKAWFYLMCHYLHISPICTTLPHYCLNNVLHFMMLYHIFAPNSITILLITCYHKLNFMQNLEYLLADTIIYFLLFLDVRSVLGLIMPFRLSHYMAGFLRLFRGLSSNGKCYWRVSYPWGAWCPQRLHPYNQGARRSCALFTVRALRISLWYVFAQSQLLTPDIPLLKTCNCVYIYNHLYFNAHLFHQSLISPLSPIHSSFNQSLCCSSTCTLMDKTKGNSFGNDTQKPKSTGKPQCESHYCSPTLKMPLGSSNPTTPSSASLKCDKGLGKMDLLTVYTELTKFKINQKPLADLHYLRFDYLPQVFVANLRPGLLYFIINTCMYPGYVELIKPSMALTYYAFINSLILSPLSNSITTKFYYNSNICYWIKLLIVIKTYFRPMYYILPLRKQPPMRPFKALIYILSLIYLSLHKILILFNKHYFSYRELSFLLHSRFELRCINISYSHLPEITHLLLTILVSLPKAPNPYCLQELMIIKATPNEEFILLQLQQMKTYYSCLQQLFCYCHTSCNPIVYSFLDQLFYFVLLETGRNSTLTLMQLSRTVNLPNTPGYCYNLLLDDLLNLTPI